MTLDDGLLDRVRKLLAKADGTDNPHEADVFSAKAAELVARHRIDPVRLAAAADHDELGVRRRHLGRGAYVRGRLALLLAVASTHDVEVVYETGPLGMTAVLAGFRSDLDVVDVLFESLHGQAATQMAAETRATPAATQRWRRAFLFGFAERARELLGEARRAAARSDPATSASTLPILRARADRVHEYAGAVFGRVVKAAAPAPVRRDGWRRGHEAAGWADLGRSRLARRRAIGRGGRP